MTGGSGKLSRASEEELAVWLVGRNITTLAEFALPALGSGEINATIQVLQTLPEPSPEEQLWRWLVQAECVLASVGRGRIPQGLLKSGPARDILEEWNHFLQDQAADLKSRARSILGGLLQGRGRQGGWPALALAKCLQMPAVNIGWDKTWAGSMVARLRSIAPHNRGTAIALLLAFLWRDAGALGQESGPLEADSGCVFNRVSDLVRCIRMPDTIFLERPGLSEPRIFQPAIQASGRGQSVIVAPPTLLVPPLSILQDRFRTILNLYGGLPENETHRFLAVDHWQQTEPADREPLVSLLFPSPAGSGPATPFARQVTSEIDPPPVASPRNVHLQSNDNQVVGVKFQESLLAVVKSMSQPFRQAVEALIADLEQAVSGPVDRTVDPTWFVSFANRLLLVDQTNGICGDDLPQVRLGLGIVREALHSAGRQLFPAAGADEWVFDSTSIFPVTDDDQTGLESSFHARVSPGKRFLALWGEGTNGQMERAPRLAVSMGIPTTAWAKLNRFLGEPDHALNGIMEIMVNWAGNSNKPEQARLTAERLTVERYSEPVKVWLSKAGNRGTEFDAALCEWLMELGGFVLLVPAQGSLSMVPENQIRIVNKSSARHFSNIVRVVCPGLLGPTGTVMAARVEVD